MYDPIVVKALPSSFVSRRLKLAHERGSGEAKLFVGPTRNEQLYNDFFAFDNQDVKYKFDKNNLLEYLEQVKIEYSYQSIHKYKEVDLELWDSNYNEVQAMAENDFFCVLLKHTDSSRYYVRAEENVFKTLFRKIALPKLTDIVFSRDDDNGILINIELHVNYVANAEGNSDEVMPVENEEINYKTGIESDFHHNRIIFGAPGTGKSYDLNQDKDTLLKNGGEYERVTFHPDYSYANFVGTYKPTMLDSGNDLIANEDEKGVLSVLLDDKTAQEKYDLLYDKFKDGDLTRLPLLLGLYSDDKFKTKKKDGSDASGDNSVERNHGRAIRPYVNLISNKRSASEIAYEYVPGPFMRTYVKALKNAQTDNPKPYLLIVEEINRANVAAVFGDVFQLLDRDEDNVSEYAIQASEDIKKYLAKELGGNPREYSEIKIPDNMFIWATMNSADQGVFPMDTAFKRRWNFDYLGINHNENDIKGNFVSMGSGVYHRAIEWNELRKAINNTLSSYKINEDKLLGPYFLSRKIVVPNAGNEINANIFISAFKSKVLMYLFDDAAKQKRASLFDGCMDTTKYSSICEEFDKRGVEIFCKEIRDKFPRAIATVAESPEEYK
ncbi:AAA family ATPase [Kurthia gibsonii]|uniref:AAA family ATPase n=1 Tax=Kurthia gibsonii TaxID=33946 RepID=UPI002DBE659A|nr:AAA family ATPase [Kurthia gibsonii]MEB6113915.1 AAA family ATPase [Kurthia gibsonii]MEB7773390.1 AAA family ATPase [Kurthia gibsonii]